jgi:hypothetical protein
MAAAAFVSFKHKNKDADRGLAPEDPNYIHNIPPESDHELDLRVGSFLNGYAWFHDGTNYIRQWRLLHREWQERRVIVTKETISFAIIGEDQVVDEIPLAEIDAVEEILDESQRTADESLLSLQEMEKVRRFRFALQITTSPGGYNSGRTYCLQVSRHHAPHLWVVANLLGALTSQSSFYKVEKPIPNKVMYPGIRPEEMQWADQVAQIVSYRCPRKGRGKDPLPKEPGPRPQGAAPINDPVTAEFHPIDLVETKPSRPLFPLAPFRPHPSRRCSLAQRSIT